MTGTLTNGPILTLEHIRKAMDLVKPLPLAPYCASSKEFVKDYAWRFTQEGREYILAHPGFWASGPVWELNTSPNPWTIQIFDLDSPACERERKHVWAVMRKQIIAMLSLPDPSDRGA